MATGRVCGNWAVMMMMATVMGTLSSIPTMPHSMDHRMRLSTTTSGLILSVLPIRRGSMMLPTSSCTIVTPMTTTRKGVRLSNCTRASRAGRAVAVMEPIVGTKLNRKIRKDQNSA